VAEQVDPQWICVGLSGLEVDVTVPLPTPKVLALVTLSSKRCRVKATATDFGPVILTVQVVPETASHPLQPWVEPVAGAAVSVTTVPRGYAAEQVGWQLIWLGLAGFDVEVTVPVPLPDFATVRVTVTVKLFALVAVPPGVVTLSGPVVAPVGTVARIDVDEITVKVAALTPLNVTAVAPVRSVPLIVTAVPTGPLVGLKLVIVGPLGWAAVTVKLFALVAVPPGVVTLSGPVVAPVGTVA
jgi:hypothetical protein